jgi:hypothetical protein
VLTASIQSELGKHKAKEFCDANKDYIKRGEIKRRDANRDKINRQHRVSRAKNRDEIN